MEMRLKPSEIRFSQDSIASSFDKRSQHSYKAIGETLDDLLTGKCSIEDIPTITVQSRNGEWYTADNRRLWVFKRLEERKKCETIPVHTGWINPKKFTTYNEGMSIRIRGNAGGTHWLRSCSSQVIRERSTKEPASYIAHSISNKSKYSETVNKPKFSICELSEEFASQAVLRDRYPMSARKLTRDLSDQGNRDKLFVTRSAFGNENYSGKHISLNPTSREHQLTNCQIPRSVPVRELQSTDMNSSEHISVPLRERYKTDMNSTTPRSVSIRGRQTTGLNLTTPRSVLEKGQTTHRNLVIPFNVSRSPIQKETRGEFVSTTVVNSDTMLRLKPSDIKYPSPCNCNSCQFRASELRDVLDYIITDKLTTSMLEPLSVISLPVGYVACDPSALWILKKAERFGKCHSIKVSVVKRH